MLDNQHLNWLLPLVGIMIILSGLGNVSAWIIGPTKGILIAAQDGNLPTSWSYTNQHKVPVTILLPQGMIFTGLCSVLILMPSIESGYWVLTAMTAQMGLATKHFICHRAKTATKISTSAVPSKYLAAKLACGLSLAWG